MFSFGWRVLWENIESHSLRRALAMLDKNVKMKSHS